MSSLNFVASCLRQNPLAVLFATPAAYLIGRSLYRAFFHPLAHIPGPLLPRLTSAWLNYHCYNGDEATSVHKLHQKYGPIVRIGPNDVDIADGSALNAVYAEKGGFPKAPFYHNFDTDGHVTIFSATDPAYRAPRAKAVMPLFSSTNLRAGSDAIYACVHRMIRKLRTEAASGKAVNLINIGRSLAADAVTSYLFQSSYGGLEEDSLSAAGMVDLFVAGNRFFYLPGFMYNPLLDWISWLFPDSEADESLAKVTKYTEDVVAMPDSTGNFPSRLLKQAGISTAEAVAQCQDLIFAGVDSSGMNFATLLLHLSRSPDILAKLKAELTSESYANVTDPIELQSLPYLRAVIREALRISMSNPARMARVVPAKGWVYEPSGTSQHQNPSSQPVFVPAGALVSCTFHELHFNPVVFPRPFRYEPERWLEPTETADMRRDWIPFGLGSRQCIARNLAMAELFAGIAEVVRSGVLEGSAVVDEGRYGKHLDEIRVPILEWFNSKVVGGRIELVWN